jgi:tetratricopeptide (TPR) repeat protein
MSQKFFSKIPVVRGLGGRGAALDILRRWNLRGWGGKRHPASFGGINLHLFDHFLPSRGCPRAAPWPPSHVTVGMIVRGVVALIILALLFAFPSISQAASQEAVHSVAMKLDCWSVEEAWVDVKALLDKEPKDPELLDLAAQIAFHRGEYQEALKLMKSAAELGGGDEKRKGFALFMEETIAVVAPFKRYETPHFVISLDERQDGVLIDYLTDTLEKTYRVMAQQYGFQPKDKIRVEVFPDARAFYYASTLSARDIEVTGAVGLTQFNKLMLLSPRTLVYGYRWLDAISHEYMHYLIMKVTANKAPIWFHEGLAKYEETRWRAGPSYLSPLYQTLLAHALADGKLIEFERMEPSLIKLDTPEDVQLAYAQAASAVEFIIARAGHPGLAEVMSRMATYTEKGASAPIQAVLGMDFQAFEAGWKEFLKAKGLKEMSGASVRRLKIKEGRINEESMDMEEIKSLVARNRAHLGDLLKEKGRMSAAVLEYRRALADTQDSVPLMNRLAAVLIGLGRDEEALQLLERARELSPDHPTTYTNLGQARMKLKDFRGAKEALVTSIQINPFNPGVHRDLAAVYEMLGEKTAAVREIEIARRLVQ